MGISFTSMGLFFILGNKFKHHRSVLPRSVHAFLGTVLFVGLAVQISYGWDKLEAQRAGGVEGRPSLRLHR
jgi:hypothetical protein